MLKAFLATVVVGILLIALIYVGDIAASTFEVGKEIVANASGIGKVNTYSSVVNSMVETAAWVSLLVLGGILLVYSIHIRRR